MSDFDIVLAGDLILDHTNPDHWLSGIAPALHDANLAIGHLEVPHTVGGRELKGDVPAPGANPEHIAALARAGFDAVSLAGNHMSDCGAEGIEDTISELARAGIRFAGAGSSISVARLPGLLTDGAYSVGLLSYNCVGPENSWASEARAGCAYIRVETSDGAPISPSAPLCQVNRRSLADFQSDIAAARTQADIVIVSLHKGIVHTPFVLAPYERPVAQAAIDAGADIVFAHHAHIVRGIELYRGKPIFHGLGNGCVVTKALSLDQSHAARAEWARRRRQLFGFEPDPSYHLAPFHPEAVHAMLGRVRLQGGATRVGFIPVFVEPPGRPVIVKDARATQVIAYLERITQAAGLAAIRTTFDGDCAWLN
jgi:poly-gamma-glutamate capsule biosynthesis protein CapA/YwtB (metallophosphatase superfamily)